MNTSKPQSKFMAIMVSVSVMLLYLLNAETNVVSSALGEITMAFPDVSPTLISLFSTIPVIIMFIMSFVSGALIQKCNKKSLAIFSLAVYTVGGVMGFWLHATIYQLLIGRAILAVGAGISAPLCGVILSELYEGDKRNHMLGLTNGVSGVIQVLLSIVVGPLMLIDWYYIFLVYFVFLVVLVLVIIFLPSFKNTASAVVTKEKAEKPKVSLDGTQKRKLIVLALFVFFTIMGANIYLLKVAIYVAEFNVGSVMVASMGMAAMGASIVIVSFVFGFIHKVLRRFTMAFSPILVAVSYIILLVGGSAAAVILALVVCGVGSALLIPTMQSEAASIGDGNASVAIPIVFGMMFLGQFVSTFFQAFLGLFVEPSTMNVLYGGLILTVIVSVLYLLYIIFAGKSKEKAAE